MINDYSKGGLKMIDIASFNQALKMKWVKSYLDDQDTGKWKLFFNHRLAQFGGKLVFWGNLRVSPWVHQAGVLHAISPISMKLGQFKGNLHSYYRISLNRIKLC